MESQIPVHRAEAKEDSGVFQGLVLEGVQHCAGDLGIGVVKRDSSHVGSSGLLGEDVVQERGLRQLAGSPGSLL